MGFPRAVLAVHLQRATAIFTYDWRPPWLYLSNYYIRMFIKPRQSTHIHHMGNSRHITNHHRVYILIWADNDVHAKMFDYHCESCASLTDDDNNVLQINDGVIFGINDLYKSFVTFACTVL